ncbi:hypothetical protein FA15DRAFT_661251 [Coprinopsis marcescibilis]|uniref:Uncharacterized protein n=1 Tax=Coprinopsis marcescibilis TaxID=230819 RepID=A0A5C3KCR0_COPMA|nr:hypothetical protein FA15DRAFT_661251 [Coprinopsis marcescibilis]
MASRCAAGTNIAPNEEDDGRWEESNGRSGRKRMERTSTSSLSFRTGLVWGVVDLEIGREPGKNSSGFVMGRTRVQSAAEEEEDGLPSMSLISVASTTTRKQGKRIGWPQSCWAGGFRCGENTAVAPKDLAEAGNDERQAAVGLSVDSTHPGFSQRRLSPFPLGPHPSRREPEPDSRCSAAMDRAPNEEEEGVEGVQWSKWKETHTAVGRWTDRRHGEVLHWVWLIRRLGETMGNDSSGFIMAGRQPALTMDACMNVGDSDSRDASSIVFPHYRTLHPTTAPSHTQPHPTAGRGPALRSRASTLDKCGVWLIWRLGESPEMIRRGTELTAWSSTKNHSACSNAQTHAPVLQSATVAVDVDKGLGAVFDDQQDIGLVHPLLLMTAKRIWAKLIVRTRRVKCNSRGRR